MFNQLMQKGRRLAGIGSVVAALGLAAPVMAQDKEPIVFGGSLIVRFIVPNAQSVKTGGR